jgi:hypothetical protein
MGNGRAIPQGDAAVGSWEVSQASLDGELHEDPAAINLAPATHGVSDAMEEAIPKTLPHRVPPCHPLVVPSWCCRLDTDTWLQTVSHAVSKL